MSENENLESFFLLWLDASVNTSEENLDAQKQLRQSINFLQPFYDAESCEKYIRSISPHDRIVFIVSGRFGESIVPRIHDLLQVSAIYVYCHEKKYHSTWSKEFKKVRGVIVLLDELISTIRSDQERRNRRNDNDALIMHVNMSTICQVEQSTSDLDGQFVNVQLLLDCLVRMKPSPNERNDFLHLCRKFYDGNEMELAVLKQFEKEYKPEKALWWYTKETFVYRIMNKALRTFNIDMIFAFRFLIRDINQELRKRQCSSPLKLYRGQLMSMNEIHALQKCTEQFVAMNAYFSTTLSETVASKFHQDPNDFHRVLFVIKADPNSKSSKAFADITASSCYPDEDEILFQVGTIFQLKSVKHRVMDDVWIIQLELISDDQHDSQPIFNQMKNEKEGNEPNLLLFGDLIRQMGKYSQAEKYLRWFLKEKSNDPIQVADCYHSLGMIEAEKDNIDQSLKHHQRALAMKLERLRPNDLKLAISYFNLGIAYRKKDKYTEAQEAYKKALEIWTSTSHQYHPKLIACVTNLGSLCQHQEALDEALFFYKFALKMGEDLIPIDYRSLSVALNNMGNIYYERKQYQEALDHYQRSLKFKKKIYVKNHPNIATTCRNIAKVYEEIGSKKEAQLYFQQAADIDLQNQ